VGNNLSCAVEKRRRKGKDLQLGCRYGYIYLPGTWVPTQQGRYMRYVDTQVGTVTVPPSKQLFVLEQQCFLKTTNEKVYRYMADVRRSLPAEGGEID